jgi:hypothetical protein
MQNVFNVRERSKKKFSKILFSKITKVIQKNNENKGKIRRNKYLSLFRKNFRTNSSLRRNIRKYFSKYPTSYLLKKEKSRRRYSILKTFIGKPELKYSNNNVNITLYIYNKNSMFTLKKLKKNFDLVKEKFTLNTNTLKSKRKFIHRYIKLKKNLKNKFIYRLNNKSAITFFLYM